MSKVRIEVLDLHQAKVWVDGVEQKNLVGISLNVGMADDEAASLVLTQRIYGGDILACGAMEVTVLDNQGSREWTPAQAP